MDADRAAYLDRVAAHAWELAMSRWLNAGRALPAVAERQLIEIQRPVFFADVVKLPVNRALHDRPEALDRVGMDTPKLAGKQVALRIAGGVIDPAMRHEIVDPAVGSVFVRRHRGRLGVDHFANRISHLTYGEPIPIFWPPAEVRTATSRT